MPARLLVSGVNVLFVVMLVMSMGVEAQTYGEVTGRVTDPSGAVIPAAALTLTNVNTNTLRNTVTTNAGTYSFPSVPPGLYRLTAEVPGFKLWTSQPFEVRVQQSVRLDVELQIGQTSERIEVAASAELLQAENASLGTVVENKLVTEIPLNGRNYLGLVALSPNTNVDSPPVGLVAGRQGSERAAQSISAGGQRVSFDYYTLDGVSNTDPNFNTYVALPSIDAIQEFKVQLGVYPAEFGHNATQVNVVTKSGGNRYHGTAFEFMRNDKLDAKPYQFTSNSVRTAPFLRNDFGFELDGPVRIPGLFQGRDKLFFMANYEAFRLRTRNLATSSLPTAKMFQGDFSELSEIIYDPLTGQPFPGNKIPEDRISPISKRLLNYYKSATLPGLTNNYQELRAAPQNRDGFVVRLDFNESPASQWMGRYNWGDENQSNQNLAGAGSLVLTNYEQYVGSNTRTFSPTLVNEARFGYTRLTNSVGTQLAFKKDVVSEIGIPGLRGGDPITWGIPNVSFTGSGFSGLGDGSDGPAAIDNNTLQFIDKLSWVRGSHTFAFGLEYGRQNFNVLGQTFSRGLFEFQANATRNPSNGSGGNAFAEFLLGELFQSTVAVNIAEAKFQRNMVAAFVDDTWKVASKLTLSLGLRYEWAPPFTNQLGNLFNVKIPKLSFGVAPAPSQDQAFFVRQEGCTDPYEGLSLRWTNTKAVCGGMGKNLMRTQNGNFAPRIGISYAPDKNTVIRSGFGLFYVHEIGNAMYFDLARNIAARVTLRTGDPGTGQLTWANAIPGGSTAIAQIPPPYGFAAAFSHETSYTMQYLLNVQRQIGQSWMVEAGYLGSVSRHLYGFLDANQANPSAVSGGVQARRPFTGFGTLQLVADGFNASYNSGSIKATRRFNQGMSFTTSYTWSHSIDNSSGLRNQGFDQLFPQDSRCLRCERGPSAFDVRHRWVLGGVFELPVGRGRLLEINHPVGNALAGGWSLNPSVTIQSGVPTNVNAGFDVAGIGTPQNTRPNATGARKVVEKPTPARWFNPAAFTIPNAGTFGNVGRNSVLTPAFQRFDLALQKRFAMPYSEGHNLQFRLEAFNVLNHPAFGAPNGNLRAGAPFPGAPANAPRQGFGVITSTRIAMRQLQVGLKYTF